MITLEDKSKFKIKDERYCMIAQNMNYSVTCVFNTKKTSHVYKTGNLLDLIGSQKREKNCMFSLCISFMY